MLAESPRVTLYTEGFSRFVTSTTAPTATGWSDSCRVGVTPTERSRLCTAHVEDGHYLPRQQRAESPLPEQGYLKALERPPMTERLAS